MIKFLLTYFIISLLCGVIHAQELDSLDSGNLDDSLTVQSNRPISLLASWNYLGYTLSKLSNSDLKEVSGEIVLFSKIVFVGEYGQEDREPRNAFKNATYNSQGDYRRLGLGYRYALDAQNFLTLTARICESKFDESAVVYFKNESGTSEFSESYTRTDQKLQWIEIILSTEQKLKFRKWSSDSFLQDFVRFGADIRYKWRESIPEFYPIEQYYIPGYGRAISSNRLSANVFIKIRIF